MAQGKSKKLSELHNSEALVRGLSEGLRTYAVKRWPLSNNKQRKARLANLLRMSDRRLQSFWNGETTMSVRHQEAEAIRALIQKPIEGQNDELEALKDRISQLEARLAALDAQGTQQGLAR
jgi:hypothetical protein